jgi:UPF0716 protein FxsA
MMWLLLVFIAWPLTEIGLFVTLGGWFGLWLSLAIVIGTTFLGAAIIRMQGVQVNSTVRAALQRGQNPGPTAAKGALNVLAGVLLVLPGFLTDILGLFLLLPPVQFGLMAILSRRAAMQRPPTSAQPDVIQGEWTRLDPDKAPPSGWTRH